MTNQPYRIKTGLIVEGEVQASNIPTQVFLSHTTAILEPGATEDFTIEAGNTFHLLSVTASTPAWVRVYGTSAARAADTRTSPGGTPPLAGSEFYAELVTTTAPQTIRFSPVPLVQGTSGNAFVRVQNMDTVSRTINLDLRVITLEEYQAPPPDEFEELIVYWTSTGPAATTGNVTWTTEEFDSGYATTTFQGQLAAVAIPFGFGAGTLHIGQVDETVFALGTEDFTIEYWANPGTSADNEFVELKVYSSSSEVRFIYSAFSPNTYLEEAALQTSFDNETSVAPGWAHYCLQKQGTTAIYHSGGQREMFGNTQTVTNDFDMSGPLTIEAIPYAASGNETAIGQIRITKGVALYGTGNFTPPTEAFYIP